MRRLIKGRLSLLIFSIIAAVLVTGLQRNPNKVPTPFIGKPVPPFKVGSVTEEVLLENVTLLNVFASWCGYCRVELPILVDIAKSNTVQMIGLDYKDDPEKAKTMLSKYGNPYSIILPDPSGKLAINFGIYGTPETFVIDKKGMIRYRHVGPISPHVWQVKLLPLIETLKKESA